MSDDKDVQVKFHCQIVTFKVKSTFNRVNIFYTVQNIVYIYIINL